MFRCKPFIVPEGHICHTTGFGLYMSDVYLLDDITDAISGKRNKKQNKK